MGGVTAPSASTGGERRETAWGGNTVAQLPQRAGSLVVLATYGVLGLPPRLTAVSSRLRPTPLDARGC